MTALPATNLMMHSTLTQGGKMLLSLAEVPLAPLAPHEVLIEVEAAPINPSDLGLMVGAGDVGSARAVEVEGRAALEMDVPQAVLGALAARVGQPLPIGNEGAGSVIAAGDSPAAQALIGKRVAAIGGALYARYRAAPAMMCLVLPDGASSRDGASAFVNPLTALAFVETMRMEGHKAIVHTAAASNLGQMLLRICQADGVPLINIVRSEQQADMLKAMGADHVLNSGEGDFPAQLTDVIAETGATLAFDAIGGGRLGSQILGAMEAAAVRQMPEYSRYGSDTFKQLYIYGALDPSPTTLHRNFGFSFAVSGFLLTPFMGKAGPDVMQRMRARVAAELTTTFASHYSHEISLAEALDPAVLQGYNAKRTGEKYLLCPQRD